MTFMMLYSRVIEIEFYVMLLLFNLISLLVSIITSFALFKLKVEPAMPYVPQDLKCFAFFRILLWLLIIMTC